jgi:hypothetical protein
MRRACARGSVVILDKKKEFNRVIISLFAFIVVALLIIAASYDTPVQLLSLKFSMGLLFYPLALAEAAIIGSLAMIAFRKEAPTAQ